MIKLMKLEMRKFKLKRYILGAFIANIVMMALILSTGRMARIEKDIPFDDITMALTVIETFVRGTFIIFAAVLISRLIIDEFRSKSIMVLFMYPIDRKKLMLAKLLIVVLFTFCSMLVSVVLQIAGFSIFNAFAHVLPDNFTIPFLMENALGVIMNALAGSVMCLIPLYFGMRKYSSSTTIVSSLLIVMIVCQYYGETSLNSIIIIPVTLVLIGASIAYLTVKNIERRDVL